MEVNWIKSSDRLPDYPARVIGYEKAHEYVGEARMIRHDFLQFRDIFVRDEPVLYWCLLPEPPLGIEE